MAIDIFHLYYTQGIVKGLTLTQKLVFYCKKTSLIDVNSMNDLFLCGSNEQYCSKLNLKIVEQKKLFTGMLCNRPLNRQTNGMEMVLINVNPIIIQAIFIREYLSY